MTDENKENKETVVDAGTLEDAVEKAQEARQKETGPPIQNGAQSTQYYEGMIIERLGMDGHVHRFQEITEEAAGVRDLAYARVQRFGLIMEACVKEALRVTTTRVEGLPLTPERGPSDIALAPEGRVRNVTDLALALFRKVTEGDERRELTGLFEKVAAWWMAREEQATKDLQASRQEMEASRKRLMVSASPADPVLETMRVVVNSLLDGLERGQRSKAADTVFTEEVNEVLAEKAHDLVLWLKMRQLGSKRRAEAAAEIEDKEDMAHYLGRAVAYEDAWRQGIWPGKAVQDGTLDPDEFKSVDLTWREKAADMDAKIMGKK